MQHLNTLLESINAEPDLVLALENVVATAQEVTASRNSMIALLNVELGTMELRIGSGSEWTAERELEQIKITTQSGIVAYVAATGKPYIAGDVSHEERYLKLIETTRSEMAVPIVDRFGRIRGVINVESDRENAYDVSHLNELITLAAVAAVAVNREDIETRESALVEIGHALDRASTEEEVVKGVLRIGDEVLRFQAFSVFLYERASDRYVLRGSIGYLKDRVGQIAYKVGQGITGTVAKILEPILSHEPIFDPRWMGQHTEFPGEEIASFLAVPVVHRGNCVAILRALRRVSPNKYLDNRFDANDVTVLTAIGEQMAVALDGVRGTERLLRSERMAAWGELSAKSSHMIGNRVFALKGDVNELGHVLQQPELARTTLNELHQSLCNNLVRIEEILQDFRDFLTATQIDKQPLDLNELVETTTREIFPRRSKVELKINLDPSLVTIEADGKRLRRAISELIENSINHVDEGVLSVTTGPATRDMVFRARLSPSKSYVYVSVADTGPGIIQEKKEAIFQPFFSGRVKGMGLGLSIVKGIAESHGGTVYEGGEVDHGANFVILLPAS
ncbi:MAG: GAF domain-containing protein [Fimbriimonadaceae bacterium]